MNRMNAYTYLRTTSVLMVLSGAVFVLAPSLTSSAFGLMVYAEPDLPEDFSEEARSYIRLAHAVMGSVMVGWFATLRWMVTAAERGTQGAWTAAVGAFAGWFVLDTGYSLLSGFWQNAVLNTAIALLFLPGFVATRPFARVGEPAHR